MGIGSIFKLSRFRKADNVAQASDEVAESADEVDDAVAHVDFSDDRYAKRLFADMVGRGAEQPSRAVSGATRNLALASKYGGGAAVAGTGLYVGNKAYQSRQDRIIQESQEATLQEYAEARKQILQNDNMSPEEKQEALEDLSDTYEQAVEEAGGPGGGSDNWFMEKYNDIFGDMGITEKVIMLIIVIAVLRTISSYAQANGGMGQ